MAHCMKAIGGMIRPMEKEDLSTQMVMFMRGTGCLIKLKDMEYILTWMVPNTKASGRKISSMVKERRHGLMEQCMRVTIFMAKNTAKETLSGAMAQYTKGSSLITTLRERENTDGQMAEHSEDSGRTIRCMAEVCSHGLMEGSMKVNT